jgi:hypothetical protein
MIDLNYLIKYNKSKTQLDKLFTKDSSLKVIYNVLYEVSSRQELNIIKRICDVPFINSLFLPLFQNGQRVVNVLHTTLNHKYLSFAPTFVFQHNNSKLILEIPIDNDQRYILILCENNHTYQELLYFIAFFDGTVYYPIYHSQTYDYMLYQNVKNDDKLLGFYTSQKVNLPSPICWRCKFYSHEPSILGCAVNPSTKTNYCFDCRDYQEATDEEIESYFADDEEGSIENNSEYHYI